VAAVHCVGGTEAGLPHTDDPWVRFMKAKGFSHAHSATLPGRGIIAMEGALCC
jgi:hypothetical protein